MAVQKMTTAAAGQLAWRIRKLHRRGDLTHADLALADALLWSSRKPGLAVAVVSYSALQRLARVARGTVAAGLRRLEALGILHRIKRRLRVLWGCGGSASRQDVSAYVLHADCGTEFNQRTVIQNVKVIPIAPAISDDVARLALNARCRTIEARLLREMGAR